MIAVSEHAAEGFHTISNILLILGAIMAVAGTIGAFWSDGILKRFSDEKISNNILNTASANEKAARANERAATLEKEAASARLELEKLKEKNRPRTITDDQRKRFIAFMAPIEKGKVSMKCTAGNNESIAFATLLGGMIAESGCEVVGPMLSFISTGAPVSGIELKMKNKDAPPIHSGNLQKAFEHIGISAPASVEADAFPISDDMVVVYVYGKY